MQIGMLNCTRIRTIISKMSNHQNKYLVIQRYSSMPTLTANAGVVSTGVPTQSKHLNIYLTRPKHPTIARTR